MLKKMQKRVCAVLALALILGMSFAGQKVQAKDIAKGNGWILDATGKVTIEDDDGMKDWEDKGADSYWGRVKSAEIKEGVTYIGYRTFKDTDIKEIVIPSTIETLGDEAFADCKYLTRVTIPASVRNIEKKVFEGSALKEVLFEGSPSVDEKAFGCPIEKVIFRSKTPVSFQEDAFSADPETDGGEKINYASGITFHIPEGSAEAYKEKLKKTGYSTEKIKEEPVAESGKDSMPLPEREHDTESAKDKVTQTYQWDEATGTLTVNEREGASHWLNEGENYLKTQDVKRLEFKSKKIMRETGGAFTNVEEIVLHEGVEEIEAQAFQGTKIKNLVFPSTIKKIEAGIFRQANKVESIEFKGEEVPEIDEEMFGNLNTNKLEIKINVPKASENKYKQRIFQAIGVEEIEFNGKVEHKEEILGKEQPEEKAEPKPEEKVEPKPEEKAESKPEEKAEPKPEEKAESKPEEKAESKPEEKAESKPEEKAEPKPEEKAEPKPEEKAEVKPEEKAEPKPEKKAEPKPGSEGNSQSKPEIETPSDKENTGGMITNSPIVEGNRAVGTETGYYPQDRKEEQVPKISYATTSSVAGQKSTVSGVFILNKGINVAVRTPQEQLKADFLLETNERLFAKILDMDLKKSNLAKASLDSIMTSVGGKPIAYLNMEMGTMKNGVYKGITESDKTISYAVEISPKDNSEKFDVIRVREGGKLDILKSQYSKGVITFETIPDRASYLIIGY